MPTHFWKYNLNSKVKPDKDVSALFAENPDRRGILFIHGFHGDAIGTWSKFPSLLAKHPACANRDIIFYGYDGLRAELVASANIFRDFLDRLLSKPADFANANLHMLLQRAPAFTYEELIIVGHSLGAVIARRALLDATKQNLAWVGKTKLVLYAPAHCGSRIPELAAEVASRFPITDSLLSLARFESPLIDQLKENSKTLLRLQSDTQSACAGGANHHLVAHKVVIAEYEKIVCNEAFEGDPPSKTIPDSDHISVCKPAENYLDPLTHLEECL